MRQNFSCDKAEFIKGEIVKKVVWHEYMCRQGVKPRINLYV